MSEVGSGAFRERLLYAALQRVMAWEMLHEGSIGHLNTEQYMQLCRDAGYDENSTQKAGTAWMNRRMDAGHGA